MAATEQNLGTRHWWSCPVCERRTKYLYYFLVGLAAAESFERALGCRECFGLTYASRSRCRYPKDSERLVQSSAPAMAMRELSQSRLARTLTAPHFGP